MTTDRDTARATAIVAATGILWGLYWLPVRAIDARGLSGAWGTAAITLAACLILTPFALARWRSLAGAPPAVLASIALGGAGFALYSVGLVHGRVAIVVLLFFLTPVWSTLIGRFALGWPTPPSRILAMAVGLAGLGLMLGADGRMPLPRGPGEWMGLLAGFLWSVSTTGIRTRSRLGAGETGFVFAAGAGVAALALAPILADLPAAPAPGGVAEVAALAFGAAGLWWVASVVALMWATVRLEPARVGILLMVEVLVGAVSAALLAGEHLAPLEIAGGLLVVGAGILEVRPPRRRRGAPLPKV